MDMVDTENQPDRYLPPGHGKQHAFERASDFMSCDKRATRAKCVWQRLSALSAVACSRSLAH